MDCDPYTPSSPRSSFSSLSYSTSATPSPEPEPGPNQRSSCLRYKGVVTQPNGRWGAQLYQDNKRIWIGTFDHQDMAAQAYDLVAIRFRGPQAITNFPMCQYTRHQLDFLAHHSEVRVINMLRNQTFEDELARFVQAKNTSNNAATCVMNHVNDVMYMNSSSRERLFEKVLTPSDVGKLHRLVIPKHYAESYLPEIIGNKADACGGMMLSFEDVTRDKMWRFRYCYWKSSQNYVLTKGWGEFVKDKGLQPGDSVIFYRCIVGDNSIDRKFFIDTNIKVNNNNNNNNNDDNKVVKEISGVGSNQSDGEVAFNSKGFRLFGVDICPLIQLDIGEVVQSNGHVN